MPRSKDDEYRDLKRETKSKGIEFVSAKYDRLTVTDVPPDHRDKYAVIQSLGRMLYSDYGYCPNGDTPYKPWQLSNKKKAALLKKLAEKCRNENQNESGWRNSIEGKLFERFDIEVACKQCRRRLWRSEFEVESRHSNSQNRSLIARQLARQPCRCNPNSRMDDYAILDSGLSNLFSSRLEEPCLAPDPSSGGPSKKPDRIHGLQRTQNFEKMLQSQYAHDDPPHYPPRLVEDVIKMSTTPDNGGSALLFPFLILEAKREKGAESFGQIEMQSAFPIQRALQLQQDLLNTRGNTMDVPGGPLVWFLAYRGENWRVYAGHVQEREGKLKYLINFLWEGSITGIHESLQLILIIDFIMDWARDTFRLSILRQLRTLGTANLDDTVTVTYDPDVFSLQGEIQQWMEGQDEEPGEHLGIPAIETAPESVNGDAPGPLDRFTTTQGIVRDARQIHSRLRALVITRNNLDTILQSFDTPNAATRFVRSVISLLSRRCIALDSEDALDAIEEHWTGHVRGRSNCFDTKPKVYAQFRISYYISPPWDQVRELTYLAATEDARELLIERAKFRGTVRRSQFSPPECRRANLICALDGLRNNSVLHDLFACLCRSTYRVNTQEGPSIFDVDNHGVAHKHPNLDAQIEWDKDKKSPGLLMQGTVHAIYERHRIGNREPSETFLRASSRTELEGRLLCAAGDRLPRSEQHLGKILVYSEAPDSKYLPDGSRQKYCLYILDGRTDQLDDFTIVTKLIWALFKDEVYSTVRKVKVPRDSRNWQDNRERYRFDMKDEQTPGHLKLSRDQFRQNLFDWIKAMAVSEPSETQNQKDPVRTWYVSQAAISALGSPVGTNKLCTMYMGSDIDLTGS